MANLVAPINRLQPTEERILEFKGINKRSYVEEGEMSDMLNLSLDDYPLLSVRKPRGEYYMNPEIVKPLHIVSRHNRLAILATDSEGDVHFYYDNQRIDALTGLSTSTWMVAINTKMCFFPEKKYIEIIPTGANYRIGEVGDLEAETQISNGTITISNEDARITLPDGHGLKYDDAIDIRGTLTYTSGSTSKTAEARASCIVEQIVDNNTIVMPRETFIELTGEGATGIHFTGTISRTMPDLDFITEWNNRLWGASNEDNTVYACKLGDPTNWHYFQGTGLDSYYAQQGTDGLWSGVGVYSGHIIFFKPNGMCRIYGTAPSNFQVTSTKCYGVEDGSRLSIVTINDVVYYKSLIGIMAYSGGTPVCISEKLGGEFANVVAGSEGQKYYASVQRTGQEGGFSLVVYDIEKGIWMKEDNLRIRGTCDLDNRLHAISYDDDELTCGNDIYASPYLVCGEGNTAGKIYIMNPIDATEKSEDIEWSGTFGPFHEYIENKKIYSKLSLRLKAKEKASAQVYISLDEGAWELVKSYDLTETGGAVIPIVPRRCDRYSIKVEGKGNCEIVSLTRRVRAGSFGRL